MYFSENHLAYIQKAAVTLSSGNQYLIQGVETSNSQIDLLHAAIGLATELGEILPISKHCLDLTNMKEEIGDVKWYLAIYDRYLISKGFAMQMTKFDDAMLFEDAEHTLLDVVLNKLLDLSKKNVFYGKEYDDNLLYVNVVKAHGCINAICKFFKFDIEQTRDLNIAKLQKRYGDKFSAHAALNRDLYSERKILEG